ncbi:hypothetical protein GY45DRAFT_1328584 [Cubamyces sp. BRFM 1775]|nr:hypothetical protein GY45DRAFT_1328584 [Cubamyces sp. BRFM 1775]
MSEAAAPETTPVASSEAVETSTSHSALASAESPGSSTPNAEPPSQPLSKKAQKKLAKAAYIAERKKERRAAEKERRKEKKRLLAEKRAAGELDPEEEAELRERERKRQKLEKGPRTPFNARVVVDLGFDEMMTENEVKSLTSQLAYTYSANRKAEHPFSSLLFTSLNGRTLTRMNATNNAAYKRWVGAEWWTEGYERLWRAKEGDDKQSEDQTQERTPHEGEGDATTLEGANAGQTRRRSKAREPSRAAQDSVVYLTADADDELTELKEGETYIIGGIVDHNRYKNLCLNKSKEHQIRSARLPIGTYLAEMRTRKVLTVNQTFEILLKWVETRDWEQALYSVIPKRKFNPNGRRRGGGGSSKGAESTDEDEDLDGEGEDVDAPEKGAGENEEAKVIDVAALEDDTASQPALELPDDQNESMEVEGVAR